MALFKRIPYNPRPLWLLTILSLLGLAAQCNTSMPPLPATPAGPTLRIALLAPTGGELAPFGRAVRNSVLMASDAWNQQGGVSNHQIEWVRYHTDCTFETAQQAARQAINDGLQFIIGPICSEAAIATARQAQAANVLMISPGATHPLVTVNPQGQPRPTIFRASYTYSLQGHAAAQFARNTLNVSRAALLTQANDDYAQALTQAFANQFTAGGGQIMHQANYTPGLTNFADLLQAVHQSKAELIYLPTTNQTVVNRISGQLEQLGLSAPANNEGGLVLLGSDGWSADELELAAAEGSYFAVHFAPDNPPAQAWVEQYKSNYAVRPTQLAALSFDAANMLAQAIQQAGTLEPAQVAQTLQQTTFSGVTGNLTFNQHHNPVKPVHFVRIQNGDTIYVTSVKP